ncbi:MAG: 5-oxoprolinase subunit PxpA [Henriciella sp.]
MSLRLDLNADLGEGCAFDAELMSVVTSCNIACGGHVGDATSMRTALMLAKESGVAAGAHPSFPDRENFGRTKSALSGDALETSLRGQVSALKTEADQLGIPITHLKPHGALYNMAALDAGLAQSVVNVLIETLPEAALFGPPNSELEAAAQANDVTFVAEGFADRAYEANGQLRDRKSPGAVIHDVDAQTEQALGMATRGEVETYDRGAISLPVKTICVHGDTPGAFAAAQSIRAALEQSGISLCPPH